ncbi:MAG: ATP phosphoribosyltransferase regulatory subunit [Caldilineaceae bacterium]|nr:ATP phosphoribosyltransferase regulatory subunit [Caldilineaceae bacterium]
MTINEFAPSPRVTHIPPGVADYFWAEAGERRALEHALLDLCRRWGYGDVTPPTFEYADVLSARANAELQAEMYRFPDRDGSILALRPDMTIAVARLAGTRLHDWPMPQRFCYAGSVFRYTKLQAARQREFRQAGVELIGAGAPPADAEVLALTAQALSLAGLDAFRLVLGQMAYFHGLLDDLALSPPHRQLLLDAVDRNSEGDIQAFLHAAKLTSPQQQTIEALLSLSGADFSAIIKRAEQLSLNDRMRQAVENLRAICDELAARNAADYLFIDLSEIYNLGYYTGITFEALTPELGFPVASGGRYDNLVGTFGAPQPAVGAALEIDRILLARHMAESGPSRRRPVPPHVLVDAGGAAACYALAARWREQGFRIVTDVSGDDAEESLAERGRTLNAALTLRWHEGDFIAFEHDGEECVMSAQEVETRLADLPDPARKSLRRPAAAHSPTGESA